MACAWFHYREYGRTLAVVSQGYLLAGACMRLALGAVLVLADDDWRLVFWASSAGAGVAALLVICCLRPGAESLRLERPLVDPQNVAGAAGDRERPERLGLLGGLLGRSPSFWLLVLFGLLVSIVRTQTVAWVAVFFSQAYGLSSADAALASTVFGVAGGVSALLVGFLYDRLGFRGRAGLVADLLLFAAAGYLLLGTGLLGLPAALLAMAFVGSVPPLSGLFGPQEREREGGWERVEEGGREREGGCANEWMCEGESEEERGANEGMCEIETEEEGERE